MGPGQRVELHKEGLLQVWQQGPREKLPCQLRARGDMSTLRHTLLRGQHQGLEAVESHIVHQSYAWHELSVTIRLCPQSTGG